MSDTLRDQQLAMWQRWNEAKREEDMHELLRSIQPIIKKEVSAYSNYPIDRNVLITQGNILARKALETYDPSRGTAIGTHVFHGLKPLNRYVMTRANTKYIPEHLSKHYGAYEQAQKALYDKYGRNPTPAEMAAHMKMPEEQIARIELAKSPEGLTSYMEEDREDMAGAEAWRDAQADRLAYFRAELKGPERKAFDLMHGRENRPPITNKGEVAKQLNMPVEDVYAMTRRWTRRLSE